MLVHGLPWLSTATQSEIDAAVNPLWYLHMSHAAVLLFFITSGYVIALTNQGPFSGSAANRYVQRRCLRIVPIYLIAILAGWLAYRPVSASNLLENIFFLQNGAWGIEPLAGNRPVWSLHFEMVYYAGFLLVWAFRPKVLPIFCAALFFGAADWFFGGPLSILGGWSIGAIFWLLGAFIAWNGSTATSPRVLGFVLLTYATNHLWPGVILMNKLGLPYAGSAALSMTDLALLPGAVAIFCGVTRITFPGLRQLGWLALAIPIGACLLLFALGRLWENTRWEMASVATVMGVPMLWCERENWGEAVFKCFRPFGKISYGLYLFHVPGVTLVRYLCPGSGGPIGYAAKIALWLGVTIGAAWICELKIQPMLVSLHRRFKGPPAVQTAPT
jgi:peptidoglycan/LPS O-acetylase OafA/YrhL